MSYLLPNSIVLLLIITFIIGVFNYKKFKDTLIKYFLLFLGYGILTEILGHFFYDIFKMRNYVIYNFYGLVQSVFYLGFFYKYFKTIRYKILTRYFIVFLTLFFIINTFYFQNIFEAYQSYFYLFGGVLLIVTIILFFVEILNSNVILKLKHLPIFWIAVGIFLFWLGFIPVFLANKYINYNQGLTYGYILLLLNMISSACFSMGFIWSKKEIDY